MKTSDVFQSNYLKAADLADRHWELIIDDYKLEEMTSQEGRRQQKPVLFFRRTKKGLVLNVTNSRTIEAAYGDEMDDWLGKPLVLFTRIVEARGEEVNAIRVRVPQPGQSTAPSHRQARPGYQSGMPERETAGHKPPERIPEGGHTEANPPPNTGQGYRDDMDDGIPFEQPWK